MTAYLEIEDALPVVDRYGFRAREVGFLASALVRTITTAMGTAGYPGLPSKAAALLESVARLHPLEDGIAFVRFNDGTMESKVRIG